MEVKKTRVFQHRFFSISRRFGFRKPLQNRRFFALFSKTSILWKWTKTTEKTSVFINFSGSEASKIHPKSMPKRNRKKQRKQTSQKSILASVLASQNLPKSTQHRKISKKKRARKKSSKTELWKPPHLNGRQAFWNPNPDHLTIFPMISTSWSASRRPNHQRESFNLKRFAPVIPRSYQNISTIFHQIHQKFPKIVPK